MTDDDARPDHPSDDLVRRPRASAADGRIVGGLLVRRELVKDDGRRMTFYDSAPE